MRYCISLVACFANSLNFIGKVYRQIDAEIHPPMEIGIGLLSHDLPATQFQIQDGGAW